MTRPRSRRRRVRPRAVASAILVLSTAAALWTSGCMVWMPADSPVVAVRSVFVEP